MRTRRCRPARRAGTSAESCRPGARPPSGSRRIAAGRATGDHPGSRRRARTGWRCLRAGRSRPRRGLARRQTSGARRPRPGPCRWPAPGSRARPSRRLSGVSASARSCPSPASIRDAMVTWLTHHGRSRAACPAVRCRLGRSPCVARVPHRRTGRTPAERTRPELPRDHGRRQGVCPQDRQRHRVAGHSGIPERSARPSGRAPAGTGNPEGPPVGVRRVDRPDDGCRGTAAPGEDARVGRGRRPRGGESP